MKNGVLACAESLGLCWCAACAIVSAQIDKCTKDAEASVASMLEKKRAEILTV